MPDAPLQNEALIREAFLNYEREVRIQNFQVASILALLSMPAGFPMDYFVYPSQALYFFKLRLLSAFISGLVWWFGVTPLGLKCHHFLGVTIAAVPSFFISWMVYATEGPDSPYYAGLNVVLLGAVLVLRWSVRDSALVFLVTLTMYLGACVLHSGTTLNSWLFISNLWFMSVTGTFVVIGSYFYNRIRFREFALRYELDQNQRMLRETNEKLLELDQLKSRFFANISHELRTPLTLLLAPLETLRRQLGRSLDPETRDLLATMQSNGMRLLKLINDLLDLVRLESGHIEVKRDPLNLAEFLNGLGSTVHQVAQDRRIHLRIDTDPALGTVLADADKLEKILLNLLFNALKFTPADGRVELRANQEGGEYVLRVTDTGMGISEKHLPHVFDRFWQADNSSQRKYQGMGIGLALVKELVEVQGGQVSVSSQEGKGTTFAVRLPYTAAESSPRPTGPEGSHSPALPHPAPGADASSEEWLANLYRRAELFPAMTPPDDLIRLVETAQPGNRPKVLVADDEPDMLRFLATQLSRHYAVIEAVNGRQAVEKACQSMPDIILLDMMMPEQDGLQACQELRQRAATQNIPIVMLTARADEETKLAALSAGANDFLAKPFSTTELHARLKNLVESFQYQRKLARQNQVLEATIDQLKETESQLIQNEKLASLGRMSAGIIHEINNPLNFATTGVYTLKKRAKLLAPEHREEYADLVNDIEEGLQRVQAIIADLRSFSHHENELTEPVEVAGIVTAALRFLSHEWRGLIQIHEALPAGLSVFGNKNKLTQVMVNLLHNAVDAVKRKAYPSGDTPAIWIEGRLENQRSLIVVRDNGTGISAQHLDKIFDPFFTTKEVGEGMGLGLSIVYRLVRDFGGHIRVRSEPGKFSEFTLDFPLEAAPAGAPEPDPNRA